MLMVFWVFLGSAGEGWSADFDKGLNAARVGDFATALSEWKPLAEQGDTTAQINLGVMYEDGKGVSQDYESAVKWYRLAAEQGDVRAQINLGLMYANGAGVIQDNVYAHMWSNIAASTGDKEAIEQRDNVAKRMNPADLSKAKDLAVECVRKKYKGC